MSKGEVLPWWRMIRPLARGTKQSTEEIQSTIEKMQELVETTVSAIKDSQKMTDNLVKVSVRPQRNMQGEQKVLQK